MNASTAAPAVAPDDNDATAEDEQVRLVRETFAKVQPIAEAAAEMFYNKLFELDPALRDLFKGDMAEQGRKLMAALATVVKGADDLDAIMPAIRKMGARHAGYGVQDKDYATVAEALLWTLEQGLGDDFTADVKDAWASIYTVVANAMKEAARAVPANDDGDAEPDDATGRDGGGQNKAESKEKPAMLQKTPASSNVFEQMVDDMPINVMVCDTTNFEITYANKSSLNTLKTLEHVLPCKADELVGQCIDIFHKDPSHQRKLLADPSNLPHTAIIDVGGEKLDLLASAVYDEQGNYSTAMLTWSVVTEKLKKDEEAARLAQMIEELPINVMTADPEEFKINYANKASLSTLKTLEHVLPCKADDIVGQCIDIFHKDPSMQRNLLSDPSNLPHSAIIDVAGEKLDLLVTPIFDKEGNYMAPMLSWSVVTAKLKADEESARLAQMIEEIPINVLTCDLEEFKITYANKASTNTLKTLEHVLPCSADEIVGQSIDIFHKEPSMQRRLLADPNNLPHSAIIDVAGEKLDLLVTPIFDKEGNYMAPMLSWSVVTAKLKADEEQARLMQMLDNMPINVMTCDPEDFTINYCNQTSLNTLKTVETLLPCRADEIVGQCIDIFHKEPSHQRKILSDPSNLPHSAKIKLGDETLALEVSAILSKEGDYLGPMVSWAVVTQQVALADNFETNVKGMVEIVASASTELQSTAGSMEQTASSTSEQATAVAAAAEEASTNVQTVATAAEELSASISEISRQVGQSSEISSNAVGEAERANEQVQGLAEASQKIGEVVDLINDIASQTNLLALNATIEAARAGEAGKGFAVVASEVKNLANQTAKATEEISSQIGSIQAATNGAVGSIEGITKTISEINEIASAIAAAVEQQGAATQEIARNVEQAATGTKEVTTNITSVTQAAGETGQAAGQVMEAAGELSSQSEQLGGAVDAFLVEVRKL